MMGLVLVVNGGEDKIIASFHSKMVRPVWCLSLNKISLKRKTKMSQALGAEWLHFENGKFSCFQLKSLYFLL